MTTAIYNEQTVESAADSVGLPFKLVAVLEVLCDHPKSMIVLDTDSEDEKKKPQSSRSSSEAQKSDPVVKNEVKAEETIYLPAGCRKAKKLKSRDKVLRKRLRHAAEAVEAQKSGNKILQAQHKMGLFTCKIDENDRKGCKYMSLIQHLCVLVLSSKTSKKEET